MREEDAGRIAAEHLLGLGHRRLGHVAGPLSLDTAHRRMQGFVQAVEARRRRGAAGRGGGLRRARRVRRDDGAPPPPPAAVGGVHLEHQPGGGSVRRRPRSSGSSVPADVSMVGYDDDPLADYLDVPLTTIRMPLWELGAVAVNALIDQLGGKDARDVVVETPPELVVRSSTAPPATPARPT